MTPTILIVDDDEAIRGLLGHLLKREGCKVAEAVDGAEALAYLFRSKEMPSMILLDLRMPVMDGWKFRKTQLGDPRIAAIPVVVVTSVQTAEADIKSIRASGYLKKPIETQSLLEVVRNQLGDYRKKAA